jgi:hypothetical protein
MEIATMKYNKLNVLGMGLLHGGRSNVVITREIICMGLLHGGRSNVVITREIICI